MNASFPDDPAATNDAEIIDSIAAIDVLATDFLARYRNGDRPTIDEYANRHPEYSSEIRRMFPLVASVERLKVDQQTANDGSATLAGRQFTQLGDFRIVREIGRGGMGIVFEAEQQSLSRPVAIKLLPKQSLLDDESLDRFHREARMAAAMHHSNIVPVFGTGEADGSHYLVMQLVRGESLDRRLSDSTACFTVEQVAQIGTQVADAMAYAHENGVLHRDIKPANILIEDDGSAQITDFGLARNLNEDPTTTRTLSGSLRYMAPERFRGVSDERSDLYSLGLTLFELLTGSPAFSQQDPDQLIAQMANPTLATFPADGNRVPKDMQTIVLKAMHPESTDRYQSAAEFRDDLQRFSNDEPILARRTPRLQRIIRWCRRNPRLAASIAIAAGCLLTTTIVSSIAYALTSSANNRTLSALDQSEQTLDLALESLDGVVEVLSVSPGVLMDGLGDASTFDDELPVSDVTLSPSPYAARVLESIQPLYERLSQQAPTRSDIALQMVDAGLQLAKIQHQLGRTAIAIETLQHSISVIGELGRIEPDLQEKAIRLARLHNELGILQSADMNFAAADEAFSDAIETVELLQQPDNAAQLEFARAHLALGDLPPSRRRAETFNQSQRENQIAHVNKAMETLGRMRSADDQQAFVHILYARSLLATSRFNGTPTIRRTHIDKAVAVLREQLESSPADAALRFELVQTLGDVAARRDQSRRHLHASTKRLQEALTELHLLRTDYPDTPVFCVAEVHIRHKLSAIARTQGRFSDANDLLAEAIEVQSTLVNDWPNSMPHRCWRALLYRSQAELSRVDGNPTEAAKAILNAINDLDSIAPENDDHPLVVRTRQVIANQKNGRAMEPQGDD